MAAFTYPRSEPGSAGHMDLVEQLNTMVPALRQELAGVGEDVLTRRPKEGVWSIKEVVGHLRDDAESLHKRLFMMIKLEEPRLEPYDEEVLVRDRNPQGAALDELLTEFSSQRAATVEMLSDLVHWNWARTGRHAEFGRISIRQLVDRTLAHDHTHLEHIRQLKAAAGG